MMYQKKKRILLGVVVVIAVLLLIKLYDISIVNKQMDEQINAYNNELKKRKADLNEATEKKDYYNSDEYIEKIAREQENLVKKNDIIFVTED
ncbi:MAG: hypothetical protein A2Y24_02305 [Clostridiales bacterium GWE2_32_10]|nr:MAG: hypothetical protein A2Y24_02305 [Clostridiales bacterium GWE2_32_10]